MPPGNRLCGCSGCDVRGEEFDEAAAGVLAPRGDHCRPGGGGRGEKYRRRVVEVRFHDSVIAEN